MRIDTHCHLDKEYYPDLEQIISRMDGNYMIANGVNIATCKEVVELCNKYNNIYGAIGIHPEDVESDWNLDYIDKHLNNPKIVAVGEIGLDYYYTKDNIEKQKELFISQIEIAKRHQKPIIVHTRDSISDMYEILKKYCGKDMKVIIHAYSGSVEMAKELTKLGYMLGIGGVVTFKNGIRLKEVVKEIPLEYLLLETDSPFLTPEPNRGKRNEPFNTKYVAEKIAEIKGVPVEDVEKITTQNAVRIFDLKI